LFRRFADDIVGIVIVLPNFGDEKGVAGTIKLAGLNVPVLVQAYPDELNKMDVAHRSDAWWARFPSATISINTASNTPSPQNTRCDRGNGGRHRACLAAIDGERRHCLQFLCAAIFIRPYKQARRKRWPAARFGLGCGLHGRVESRRLQRFGSPVTTKCRKENSRTVRKCESEHVV
jgi:hypothetical protein